ncbi:hypothetical protein NF27_HU00010, partial [Candidatus Jidaibacter acanthamoeba]
KLLLEHTSDIEKREAMIHVRNDEAFIDAVKKNQNTVFNYLIFLIPKENLLPFLTDKILPRVPAEREKIIPYLYISEYFSIAKGISNLQLICKNFLSYFEGNSENQENFKLPNEIISYIFCTALGAANPQQLKIIEEIKSEVNEESKSDVASSIIKNINNRVRFIDKILQYEKTAVISRA